MVWHKLDVPPGKETDWDALGRGPAGGSPLQSPAREHKGNVENFSFTDDNLKFKNLLPGKGGSPRECP